MTFSAVFTVLKIYNGGEKSGRDFICCCGRDTGHLARGFCSNAALSATFVES